MFTEKELFTCTSESWFIDNYQTLEESLLRARLGMELDVTKGDACSVLARFSQAVMASSAGWDYPLSDTARTLCRKAGDIEAGLGAITANETKGKSYRSTIRAAVLYDLAGMPGIAASIVSSVSPSLRDSTSYFSRISSSPWGVLKENSDEVEDTPVTRSSSDIFAIAIGEVLNELSISVQNYRQNPPESGSKAFNSLIEIAKCLKMPLDADILSAWCKSTIVRQQNSTLKLLLNKTILDERVLKNINLPSEMWPVQRAALESGILSSDVHSFGLAAPTGTGKTALTRLLIVDFLAKNPGKKALYVCPSRALTAQVANDLKKALSNEKINVCALGAHLTIHEQLNGDSKSSDVLVFTPEKADMLMRVDPECLNNTRMVIIDEAHHIEQGTRGVLLEFYLWRLRALLPRNTRIVQLSAVAPNIEDLVGWLGDGNSSTSVKVDWRTNRLRLGVFERGKDGSGLIKFEGLAPFRVFNSGTCPDDEISNLAMLANNLSSTGVVLVLATSQAKAENVAASIAALRSIIEENNNDIIDERLDARIERELYADSPLREMYKKRVIYHHAKLPPRVRSAIEGAISARRIDVVCATTTLAEGVNFPFSTVIVESLVGKDYEITPRTLWNIAGRAGRFGIDSEGHCIIFRPEKWQHRLTMHRLQDYLHTTLNRIPPVRSALADGILELKNVVDQGDLEFEKMEAIRLTNIEYNNKVPAKTTKNIQGLLNVMRVSYAHANVSKLINVGEDVVNEFDNGLLASRQIEKENLKFAERLGLQQRKVVRNALKENDNLLNIAAQIGWSLETQTDLYEWIKTLEDWKLEQFGKLVLNGRIWDSTKIGYLIGPIAAKMSEFEGDKLGGFTSFIAVKWLEGLPLSDIRDAQAKKPDYGKLVHIIYSRIQYLLPWALFGVDELVKYEAKIRNVKIGSGIRDLSVLASEGVPNFDALNLILSLDVERVDASRLADSYHKFKPQTDIMGWFAGTSWDSIVKIVRGYDRRRLDPDLKIIWEKARTATEG